MTARERTSRGEEPTIEALPILTQSALDYLRRNLHLRHATTIGLQVKLFILLLPALPGGAALAAVAAAADLGMWSYVVIPLSGLAPIVITITVALLVERPEARRWTQGPLVANALRAHTYLQEPFQASDDCATEPPTERPYHLVETAPAQVLEDLASACEQYAMHRATPYGRRLTTPQANRDFLAAAIRVRELADRIVAEGERQRLPVLGELREIINALAAHTYANLAPAYRDGVDAPPQPRIGNSRARQVLVLAAFTVASAVGIYALGQSKMAVALAPVIATALFGAWLAAFRLRPNATFADQPDGE